MKNHLIARGMLGVAILPITGLLSNVTPTHAADGVQFRLKFQQGQQYSETQVRTDVQKFSMTIQGEAKPVTQNQAHTEKITVKLIVTKVYPDGSADVKITFSDASISNGTNVINVPVSKYYRTQHITPDGKTTATKNYGETTVPADQRDVIPSTTTHTLPSKAIAIGGTWDEHQTMEPFGTITLHNKLMNITTQNGRQVATVHSTLSQNLKFTQDGVTFSGLMKGVQDETGYSDSIGSLTPRRATYSFTGTISGSVNGTKVNGSFEFKGTEVDTPQL